MLNCFIFYFELSKQFKIFYLLFFSVRGKMEIVKKEYAKAAKIVPDGYASVNHFFEEVFLDEDMIWMGQNTNELHDEDDIVNAMTRCIEKRQYNKYPPPEGFNELKTLILEDLGLLYRDVEILINAGATESLYLAMNAVLDEGHNVITPDPGYLIIDNFASRFASEIRSVPIYNEECGYKLTPKLVRENMDENTRVILLIDPLNPLGSSYTEAEMKEFAEIAIENDIFLVHDITYRDFAEEHFLAAKYAPKHAITMYSFSKSYGLAGLRLGAIIAAPYITNVVKSIIINDVGTNLVAQAGAIEALKTKPKWIDYVKGTTRSNQEIIKAAVDKCEGVFLPVYPSQANMMAIDLSGAGIDPEEMSTYLLSKKIFTRQGSYTSNRFGDNFLRVSFSIAPEKVEKFAEEFVKAVEVLRTK